MEVYSRLNPVLADQALRRAHPSVALAQGLPDVERELTTALLGDRRVVATMDRAPSVVAPAHKLRRTFTFKVCLPGPGEALRTTRDLRVIKPVRYAVRMKTKTKVRTGSLYDVMRYGEGSVFGTVPDDDDDDDVSRARARVASWRVAVWMKEGPATGKEAKFGEVLDLLHEAGDVTGVRCLDDIASRVWSDRVLRNRRSGLMARVPAGTWTNVFSLVQSLDLAAPRKTVVEYTRPDSNISFGAAYVSRDRRDAWTDIIPQTNIVVRDDYIQFTSLEDGVSPDCLWRPLVLFQDGSAVADPITRDTYRAVLDGMERGEPALLDALKLALLNPRSLRTLPRPDSRPADGVSVPTGVPEAVIEASPVLRDMLQDFSPAELVGHLPLASDPAAILEDMAAWLKLRPRVDELYPDCRDWRFMPARPAEVANLAHFLGIDCMSDWICASVGKLMSCEAGRLPGYSVAHLTWTR
jgi:hypothetical protein